MHDTPFIDAGASTTRWSPAPNWTPGNAARAVFQRVLPASHCVPVGRAKLATAPTRRKSVMAPELWSTQKSRTWSIQPSSWLSEPGP